MSGLNIAALVSIGRNPVNGAKRASRNDVLALDLALALPGALSVFHAGDPAVQALTEYLAYGADAIQVLPIGQGDALAALANALQGFGLILCGQRAEAGEGSGMLPYLLGKSLGIQVVAAALEVSIAGAEAEILTFLPRGKRRLIRVPLPAVIALHPRAPRQPRYAYAMKRAGRIVTRELCASAPAMRPWLLEAAVKKPIKLKAPENRKGHVRMLSAIATESKGGVIIKDGTPVEKAETILAFLRDRQLIDF